MSPRIVFALTLGVGLLAAAPSAHATPTCAAPDRLMQWPTASPVWEFCFRTPQTSTGTSGSGIEISNAYYNGHLVFKRAHAPILNVLYLPGGCGCFRDWSNSEVKFRVKDPSGIAVNGMGPGAYYETNFPAETVCETGGSGGDIPSGTGFRGVSAEKSGDPLVLTTQMTAGWYRYVMRWKFYLDGRVQPWYGYSAVSASCINNAHTHHNYWRLDFDIDGPANDTLQQGPASPRPVGPQGPWKPSGTEQHGAISSSYNWAVRDTVSGRGYRVVPTTTMAPLDNFAVSDSWALQYKPNEIDDNNAGGCPLNFNALENQESIENQDVVLWVRGGQFHQASAIDDCGTSVYTLEPFGNWAP